MSLMSKCFSNIVSNRPERINDWQLALNLRSSAIGMLWLEVKVAGFIG